MTCSNNKKDNSIKQTWQKKFDYHLLNKPSQSGHIRYHHEPYFLGTFSHHKKYKSLVQNKVQLFYFQYFTLLYLFLVNNFTPF